MQIIIAKLYHAYKWYIVYPIDKIVNTLIWLFTPKEKVLVLNVWLRHRGNRVRAANLGDDLNYAVVSFLSKKRIISYMHSYVSLFRPRNYMCIGSIADTLTNTESIIWGSGAMYGDRKKEFVNPKEVLAVRGPLTRDYLLSLGINCPEVYGDPVLLLPLILPCRNVKKRYKLGLIPHYIDFFSQKVAKFRAQYGDNVVVVDMAHYKKWQDVVTLINECDFIASSSLHGLIIADAYRIPNVWIRLSNNIMGGEFKYLDYFGSVKRNVYVQEYINKEIDFDNIMNALKLYRSIDFNMDRLLSACPFNCKKL